MTSNSFVSNDQTKLMTRHFCTVCLKRVLTSEPNPRYVILPSKTYDQPPTRKNYHDKRVRIHDEVVEGNGQ